MKFQQEAYQDSHRRVAVLTKTVRDEFSSVACVLRNMANDAFDVNNDVMTM